MSTKNKCMLSIVVVIAALVIHYYNAPGMHYFEESPKIIHQTWDSWESIPPCCYAVIKRVQEKNKDWKYMFYNIQERRALIENNLDDKILRAFDKLPTSTTQSDLFRVCCLYVHGGFYMDCKSECGSLSSLNLDGKLLYCKWPYGIDSSDHRQHAATTFLLWPKGHQVLKAVIDEITKRIHARSVPYIRKNVTWTTGPNVYATIVCKKVADRCMCRTDNYMNGFFVHDGTNGEYYDYMKSRNLHWSQQKSG